MIPAQQDIFRLLCAALGSRDAASTPDHMRSLSDPAIAAALIELADKERVGPALHEALVACRAWQSARAQMGLLARRWEENLRRNQLIRSTLLSLAEAAARAGFEFVALKGCAWLVEDPTKAASWRSILDIDVLVDPRRFDAAPTLLVELGYQRVSEANRFRDNFHHTPYWRPDTPVTVEVHRHLGWRHQLLPPETIFGAATRIAPGLLQPAPWCRALHAIVHWQIQDCGYSRGSVPLKEVLEVARFMARPDVDWSLVRAHARAVGVMRECEAAVALAAELLGAAVPGEMQAGPLGTKRVRRALRRRSSPLSTWMATEMWRAGTLWRCEKVAYRAFLRGAGPARASGAVCLGRAARLAYLAARAITIAVRWAGLWIAQYCGGSPASDTKATATARESLQRAAVGPVDSLVSGGPIHGSAEHVPLSRAAQPLAADLAADPGGHCSLYEIYGLIIASEFALPELKLRQVASSAVSAVKISVGHIPADLIAAAEGRFMHAQNDHILLSVPQVARYCVSRGSEVLVQPEAEVDASLVRLFLLGSVMGLVCQQRGLLALHASAIAFDGEAVGFLGKQGQGKSTLAAHCLVHADARLLADDILVVSFGSDGRPWVHPGMPAVKLWRDTLQALGRGAEGLRPDWIRAEKFVLPIVDQLAQAPVRLNCIYVLDDDDSAGDARIETLSGASAAACLIANTYRAEYMELTGHRLTHFAASTRLAERVPVRRLSRCRDLPRVGSTAVLVLADFAARAPSTVSGGGPCHAAAV